MDDMTLWPWPGSLLDADDDDVDNDVDDLHLRGSLGGLLGSIELYRAL